jgi:hypothetical protein
LAVSSFESVARSMPDRLETSDRLNPWRSRSARSADRSWSGRAAW